MTVLGIGTANGGISILHALGLGKGCSVGVDLITTVRLLDEPSAVEEDDHGLLDAVLACWRSAQLPSADVCGWAVESELPVGQGLKSSSSVACAALRALNESAWAGLSDNEIADLAVAAQRRAKCTLTGSMDDVWADLCPGWKLVDPLRTASESVLLEGELEQGLTVLLGLRGERKSTIELGAFKQHHQIFERALASLAGGSPLEALSANGMAVAAATDDFEALRICNLCIATGAIAAGISGSGPAIAVVCYPQDSQTLFSNLSDSGLEVIPTRFVTSETISEEAF
jgi:shikimate kinase